jgi:hypothetical protein
MAESIAHKFAQSDLLTDPRPFRILRLQLAQVHGMQSTPQGTNSRTGNWDQAGLCA